MEQKKIIVLGCGIGGVVAATQLKKKLGLRASVIVIDKEKNYTFSPSLLWLMVGKRKPESISRPMDRVRKNGLELITGDITAIDPERKSVTVNGETLSADYLVISLGSDLVPAAVPGLEEAGFNLYTMAGAEKINELRHDLKTGKLVILVSSMPFKCPAAPYEAAMILEHDCRQRGVRKNIDVAIYTPEPGPMPVAGPIVSGKVKDMLKYKNIDYFTEHAIEKIDHNTKTLFFSNGEQTQFDFLAYVPPHKAPKVVVDSGLVGEAGWIPVNKSTFETAHNGVYAIGDVTGIKLACGKPMPKAGVFAHGQAETVVANIIEDINGTQKKHHFDGFGECFMEIGGPFAGIGKGNFYAEPNPDIVMKRPGIFGHLAKVVFEKYWLYKWY